MKETKKVSGAKLFALLPKDVQKQVKDNLEEVNTITISDFKKLKFANLCEMLSSGFRWDKCNESREYWVSVCDKKYDGIGYSESIMQIIFDDLNSVFLGIKTDSKKSEFFIKKLFSMKEQEEDKELNHEKYKNGYHYLSVLSISDAQLFIDNLNKERGNEGGDAYLDDLFYGFNDFISCAFAFITSNEGFKYWDDVRINAREQMIEEIKSERSVLDLIKELGLTTAERND